MLSSILPKTDYLQEIKIFNMLYKGIRNTLLLCGEAPWRPGCAVHRSKLIGQWDTLRVRWQLQWGKGWVHVNALPETDPSVRFGDRGSKRNQEVDNNGDYIKTLWAEATDAVVGIDNVSVKRQPCHGESGQTFLIHAAHITDSQGGPERCVNAIPQLLRMRISDK